MRALFGLDPDARRARRRRGARVRERARLLRRRDYFLQIMRGPGTPFGADAAARASSSTSVDLRARSTGAARRASAARTCSRCCSTPRTRTATASPTQHVRDEVMTLLFAGPRHDDLDGRVPVLRARAQPRASREDDRTSTSTLALDETLRLYPPAWIGPRRSVEPFEFAGRAGPRQRARQLLLVGEPPPARRLGRARGVPARALRARQPRARSRRAPTSRSAAARARASGCASARSRSGSIAARILERFRLDVEPGYELRHPPDADDRPARRPAGHRARAR